MTSSFELRRFHRVVVGLFLLTIASLSHAVDAGHRPLRLMLVDEDNNGIAGYAELDGEVFASDDSGNVITKVPRASHYLIRLEAPGYYPSVQSFSDLEVERWSGLVPAITLVKQQPGRVLMAFGGDVMLGRRYHDPNPGEPIQIRADAREQDTHRLLDAVRPYLSYPDLVSVNLESVVVAREPTQHAPKSVVFFSYPETLPALVKGGVDYVSLGNNHSYDYLDSALSETLARLAAWKLGYSGSGASEAEALAPWLTRVRDRDVSVHSFVGWAGRVTPNQVAVGASKGGAALGTVGNIRKSLALSSDSAVRVVQYHGSAEYSFEPTAETRERLRAAIDSGADLAIGHHPHVLHGFEVYKGKLIAYSLGNFLFDQYIYETQRSALLYVWMDGERFHRAEFVPLYIKSYRPTPAVGGLRDHVLRRLSEQARREGASVHFSGGHLVVGEKLGGGGLLTSPSQSPSAMVRFQGWGQVEVDSDQPCDFGWDWWAIGDHEQENLYGLVDRSWEFLTPTSGIERGEADGNHRMVLRPDKSVLVGLRQKYFMRVWNDDPKTVAFRIKTSEALSARLCLEKRERHMSTLEARDNPTVQCLLAQSFHANEDWQSVAFDFQPPLRDTLRGLRFRLEFSRKFSGGEGASENVASQSALSSALLLDDIQFISWENDTQDRRINVMRCPTRD